MGANLCARAAMRADVPELRIRPLVEIVAFHQRHAGRSVFPADYLGVAARFECAHDGRFPIVSRLHARFRDLGLLIVFPVVIRCEQRVSLEELERRVIERSATPPARAMDEARE